MRIHVLILGVEAKDSVAASLNHANTEDHTGLQGRKFRGVRLRETDRRLQTTRVTEQSEDNIPPLRNFVGFGFSVFVRTREDPDVLHRQPTIEIEGVNADCFVRLSAHRGGDAKHEADDECLCWMYGWMLHFQKRRSSFLASDAQCVYQA